MINGILILEVVQAGNGEGSAIGGGVNCVVQGTSGDRLVQIRDEGIGTFGRHLFVVISAEEGTTVDGIKLVENVIDSDQFIGRFLISGGDNVQPGLKNKR